MKLKYLIIAFIHLKFAGQALEKALKQNESFLPDEHLINFMSDLNNLIKKYSRLAKTVERQYKEQLLSLGKTATAFSCRKDKN